MSGGDWRTPSSRAAIRRRPVSVLASPWRERRFLYEHYEPFLRALADRSRFLVVPLRDLLSAPGDRVVIGLRHDVDERLDSALKIAELEHRYDLPATYFVLHTAPYYGETRSGYASHDEHMLRSVRRLQALGHEVGWHNDLVTLQCVFGLDPRQYLTAELAWLRTHGIDVRGSASHSSFWTHVLGYHNDYFFSDFTDTVPGFPHRDVVDVDGRQCRLIKGRLADFGLEYDASRLPRDHYFTDSNLDNHGHRWHPDALPLADFEPGEKVIVTTHPCFWDASLPRKAGRVLVRAAGRAVSGRRA